MNQSALPRFHFNPIWPQYFSHHHPVNPMMPWNQGQHFIPQYGIMPMPAGHMLPLGQVQTSVQPQVHRMIPNTDRKTTVPIQPQTPPVSPPSPILPRSAGSCAPLASNIPPLAPPLPPTPPTTLGTLRQIPPLPAQLPQAAHAAQSTSFRPVRQTKIGVSGVPSPGTPNAAILPPMQAPADVEGTPPPRVGQPWSTPPLSEAYRDLHGGLRTHNGQLSDREIVERAWQILASREQRQWEAQDPPRILRNPSHPLQPILIPHPSQMNIDGQYDPAGAGPPPSPGSSSSSSHLNRRGKDENLHRRENDPNPRGNDDGYEYQYRAGQYDRSDEDFRKLNRAFEYHFAKIKFRGDYLEDWELFCDEYVAYCDRQRDYTGES